MKMRFSFATILLAAVFFLLNGLTPAKSVRAQDCGELETATVEFEDKTPLFGLDEQLCERLTSSLRNGAFNKNVDVCYRSFKMFAENPALHQKLGEGVQMELVKRGLDQGSTATFAFRILTDSEIGGLERQELLLKIFKYSFTKEADRGLTNSVVEQLHLEREALVGRFAAEISKDPLGDHADKLKVIEHLGWAAEKALPALKKRYRALRKSALKEGRAANYLDLLYAVGEIQSKDGMEIILDACDERGSEEREQYALVGLECLSRIITMQDSSSDAKYMKYAKALMKTYDKDSDGFLTEEEQSKMRRKPSMSGVRDHDRRLTADEIVRGMYIQAVKGSRNREPSHLIRNSVSFGR